MEKLNILMECLECFYSLDFLKYMVFIACTGMSTPFKNATPQTPHLVLHKMLEDIIPFSTISNDELYETNVGKKIKFKALTRK